MPRADNSGDDRLKRSRRVRAHRGGEVGRRGAPRVSGRQRRLKTPAQPVEPFLAPGNLLGDRQPVRQGRGVGLLGFGRQLGRYQSHFGDHLPGALVAHRDVFAGVGHDFGAVGRHGELAELQHVELLGQLQDFDEPPIEQGLVLTADSQSRRLGGRSSGVSRSMETKRVSMRRKTTATPKSCPAMKKNRVS
jgi:hypothetical protein